MSVRVIAGDCIVHTAGSRSATQRGRVVTLVKPDDTVLVHDAAGYRPVAWLTRPAELTVTEDPLWLVAVEGEETLRLEAAGDVGITTLDITPAGEPVGTCGCAGQLVRTAGAVACLSCDARYPLPGGATVRDATCDRCGLPRIRVERGAAFDICLDYDCESLLETVADRFNGEWPCPTCGEDLEILRRGGLLAGCPRYPDCETGFAIPDGVVVEACDCGLPVFETASGRRCLDSGCART